MACHNKVIRRDRVVAAVALGYPHPLTLQNVTPSIGVVVQLTLCKLQILVAAARVV
jgi:hypothetical protein